MSRTPHNGRCHCTLSSSGASPRDLRYAVKRGADLFLRQCAKCHANIDGRGAGIPDLRRMSAETHVEFDDILLKGTRVEKGMGDFSDLLSSTQVEAVHQYLIELAWHAYENDKTPSAPHRPAASE